MQFANYVSCSELLNILVAPNYVSFDEHAEPVLPLVLYTVRLLPPKVLCAVHMVLRSGTV